MSAEAAEAVLRDVIVDDEPHARAFIASCLERIDGVDVVARCGGGEEAIRAIERHRPDVAFLDIAMPEVDGFGVIERVGPERMPAVVFITAHDEGAVRAFDLAAVDYLLKPVDEARVAEAVRRVRDRVASSGPETLARALRTALELQAGAHVSRVLVPTSRGAVFVAVDDVEWFEADGKHVVLHADGGPHRVRSTLSAIADRLDPARFARVHRSSVVNLERVREVQRWYGGDYLAIMRSGAHVRVSRGYRANILRTLS